MRRRQSAPAAPSPALSQRENGKSLATFGLSQRVKGSWPKLAKARCLVKHEDMESL